MFPQAIQGFNVNKLILLGMFLFPLLSPLQAQLSSDRIDLEKELRVIEVLLAQADERPGHTEAELAMINRQIRLRERLLGLLGQEVLEHESEIGELDDQICHIEESTDDIRQKYAESVRAIYQLREEHVWLSVLSSGSLDEAYHKIRFFRQLSRYQEQQLTAMAKAADALKSKQEELSLAIAEKETLREVRRQERDKLRRSFNRQETVSGAVASVGDDSPQIANRVFLTETIEQSPSSPTIVPPAPEEADAEVSLDYGSSFRKSRGVLPWPVRKEFVTLIHEFGRQEDSFGNSVNNNGITVMTQIGQEAFAVHSGVVTAVQRIPNGGSVVIIAHGNYRTVYAGLSSVEVTLNQTVAQGQQLGLVYTDSRTAETSMEFMVYLEPSRFLDPEKWLN